MAAWQKMGVICINADVQGVCQQCLWLEWDPAHKHCSNECTYLCPKQTPGREKPASPLPVCASPPPFKSL